MIIKYSTLIALLACLSIAGCQKQSPAAADATVSVDPSAPAAITPAAPHLNVEVATDDLKAESVDTAAASAADPAPTASAVDVAAEAPPAAAVDKAMNLTPAQLAAQKIAASHGSAASAFRLYQYYEFANIDHATAETFLRQAADAHLVVAQATLGLKLIDSTDTEVKKQGRELIEAAAKGGDAASITALAKLNAPTP